MVESAPQLYASGPGSKLGESGVERIFRLSEIVARAMGTHFRAPAWLAYLSLARLLPRPVYTCFGAVQGAVQVATRHTALEALSSGAPHDFSAPKNSRSQPMITTSSRSASVATSTAGKASGGRTFSYRIKCRTSLA